MMLQRVPDLEFVRYQMEIFPQPKSDFTPLFDLHGREVRGKPFDLDFRRYHQLEFEKRLVWIVARSIEPNQPIGYSCHYWYRDLHYNERVGADDLWFVDRRGRGLGIGERLKLIGHDELRKCGVVETGDNIRSAFDHPNLMNDLGFNHWGTRWKKRLEL